MLRNPAVTRLRIPVIVASILTFFRKDRKLIQNFTRQVVRFVHRTEFHTADAVDPRAVVGHLHPAVVARKAEHHAPAHRALEKHLGLRSLAAGTEAAVKPRTQLLEFGDAARRHGGLDLARQIDRRGAGTLREGEDVQEGRLDARQEIVRFAEFGAKFLCKVQSQMTVNKI